MKICMTQWAGSGQKKKKRWFAPKGAITKERKSCRWCFLWWPALLAGWLVERTMGMGAIVTSSCTTYSFLSKKGYACFRSNRNPKLFAQAFNAGHWRGTCQQLPQRSVEFSSFWVPVASTTASVHAYEGAKRQSFAINYATTLGLSPCLGELPRFLEKHFPSQW